MADIRSLHDAVADLIHDGDTVAMEGFTHLIPYAAAHEVIRQGITDLTLVRMTPDVVYDQLIGAGLRPQAGLLLGRQPRRRLAAPLPRRRRERLARGRWSWTSTATPGMANRYVAGASKLPFAVLRGYRGTDLAAQHATPSPPSPAPSPARSWPPSPRSTRTSPSIHAQQADRAGQRPAVGPDRRAEGGRARRAAGAGHGRGDRRRAGAAARRRSSCPTWVVDAVAVVPGGAHPSYATGYSVRDNGFYQAWDAIARDREAFTAVDRARTCAPTRPPSDDARAATSPRDELMEVNAARALAGGADLLRRHRPAQHRRQPRPRHPQPRPGARLRVRHRSAPSRPGCRCPSATANSPRPPTRGPRARDVQLLAPGRPHRRRLPRRRPGRPLRQHQHHRRGPRPRRARGPASRRRRRPRDRRQLRPGADGAAPLHPRLRREARLRHHHRPRRRPRRPHRARPARRGPRRRHHRPRRPAPRPGHRRTDPDRAAPRRHRRAGAAATGWDLAVADDRERRPSRRPPTNWPRCARSRPPGRSPR